jgi:hypothetical protein
MKKSALYSWVLMTGFSGHDRPVTHDSGRVPGSIGVPPGTGAWAARTAARNATTPAGPDVRYLTFVRK